MSLNDDAPEYKELPRARARTISLTRMERGASVGRDVGEPRSWWTALGLVGIACGFLWTHLSMLLGFEYGLSLQGKTLASGRVDLNVTYSIREAYHSGAQGLSILIAVASVAMPYVKVLVLLATALLPSWRKLTALATGFDVVNRFALLDVYVYCIIVYMFTLVQPLPGGLMITLQPVVYAPMLVFVGLVVLTSVVGQTLLVRRDQLNGAAFKPSLYARPLLGLGAVLSTFTAWVGWQQQAVTVGLRMPMMPAHNISVSGLSVFARTVASPDQGEAVLGNLFAVSSLATVLVHAGVQLLAALSPKAHPWALHSFAWCGTDVLVVALVIAAYQVGPFAETIFATACSTPCLEVTSSLHYTGVSWLILSALVGWLSYVGFAKSWVRAVRPHREVETPALYEEMQD